MGQITFPSVPKFFFEFIKNLKSVASFSLKTAPWRRKRNTINTNSNSNTPACDSFSSLFSLYVPRQPPHIFYLPVCQKCPIFYAFSAFPSAKNSRF
jgi:hypothetical protein